MLASYPGGEGCVAWVQGYSGGVFLQVVLGHQGDTTL